MKVFYSLTLFSMSELLNTYFYRLALPFFHRIFAGTPYVLYLLYIYSVVYETSPYDKLRT